MRTVLNVMAMDYYNVRRRALVLLLLSWLVIVPVSVIVYPAASAAIIPFGGILALLPPGIEDKNKLGQLYETLPMRRKDLICGRFLALWLVTLASSVAAYLIGMLALNLHVFAKLGIGSYAVIVRAQAHNRTVAYVCSRLFLLTCLIIGFLLLLSYLLERHRERVVIVTLLLIFLGIMLLFVPNSWFVRLIETLIRADNVLFLQDVVIYETVMYLLGTAALVLFGALTLVFTGRREWK
ncbi:MAG: ABC-2 transporter permease [Oscillospiraceae bacterium]|nr:ABC-2 transporter permease [Oscillospiraceae bacterium]